MALGTTNITTSLVAAALGESSSDVGKLCSSDKINRWSKYKPVRFNTVTSLTEEDLKSVNFGFTINSTSAVNTSTLQSAWTYLKPNGGLLNAPYRLGDFRGYDHLEQSPMFVSNSYLNRSWNVYESSTPSFASALTYKIGTNSYFGTVNNRLSIDDFSVTGSPTKLLKDMYYSVGLFEDTTFHCVTGSAKLSDGTSNGGANIDSIAGTSLADYIQNRLPADTPVTLYPFLNTINTKNTSTNNYNVGEIINIPEYQPITFLKDSNFWLLIEPSSVIISHASGLFTSPPISQRATGYTNLSNIRINVVSSQDSATLKVKVTVRIYSNPNNPKKDIDITNIRFRGGLLGENSAIVNKMNVVGYYNGTFNTINEERVYGVNPTYVFSQLTNPSYYYIVDFEYTAPITVFKSNAVSDNGGLPIGLRFYVNNIIDYNYKQVNYRLAENLPYRFKIV